MHLLSVFCAAIILQTCLPIVCIYIYIYICSATFRHLAKSWIIWNRTRLSASFNLYAVIKNSRGATPSLYSIFLFMLDAFYHLSLARTIRQV